MYRRIVTAIHPCTCVILVLRPRTGSEDDDHGVERTGRGVQSRESRVSRARRGILARSRDSFVFVVIRFRGEESKRTNGHGFGERSLIEF